MSFTEEIKQEISRTLPAAGHCRRALLAALFSFCGTIEKDEAGICALTFRSENERVCNTVLQLLKKLFHIEMEQLLFTQQLRAKSSVYHIRLEEPEQIDAVLATVGVSSLQSAVTDRTPLKEQALLQKECCRRAYLQGAFLAAGTASDPNRSYHLEIGCEDQETAIQLIELMASIGTTASTMRRGRQHPVYLKDGSEIADFLGRIHARVAMLAFENARIVREMRGNINRKVNCEAANIKKAATGAAQQREDIRLIAETVGLSALPPTLDEIARVRLQYPTATLQELGEKTRPPIGKSGVNHRIRKIHAYAEQLRSAKERRGEDAE